MPRIVFQPSGTVVEAAEGTALREAAIGAGVEIRSSCGGVARCGLCRVRIEAGADNLEPLTAGEKDLLGNVFFLTRERLACQARVKGDVACTVPDAPARPERARAGGRPAGRPGR